jgi:dihydrolipoamide dehydrogenase
MAEVSELTEQWGVTYEAPQIDIDKVRSRKDKVISTLSSGLRSLAKRRKVQVISGRGRLQDSATLLIEGDHESIPASGKLTFDNLILATGSTPAMPAAFQIGSDRVMDSTGALQLADLPKKLLVIGGGYIGLEMGTVYAQLGSQVSVVELMEGLLPGADRDLVAPLAKRLKKLFEDRIFLNTKVGSIAEVGAQIEVTFEGPAKFGVERYDRVLVSVGRRPCSRDLGLENTAVTLNDGGFVEVNPNMQTADPAIWAVGDVAGEPMLAHKASHEARVAVEAIMGEPTVWDKVAIPAVVFTDPEIAWAGLTESDAKRDNVAYEVAAYPWAASGRAQALARTEGMTKWLVQPESNRVLGCGIVGPGAGELIAEAVLALEMGCELSDVTETIHPHPTLSETLMNAGEVHFGTATEIYKPKRKSKK